MIASKDPTFPIGVQSGLPWSTTPQVEFERLEKLLDKAYFDRFLKMVVTCEDLAKLATPLNNLIQKGILRQWSSRPHQRRNQFALYTHVEIDCSWTAPIPFETNSSHTCFYLIPLQSSNRFYTSEVDDFADILELLTES